MTRTNRKTVSIHLGFPHAQRCRLCARIHGDMFFFSPDSYLTLARKMFDKPPWRVYVIPVYIIQPDLKQCLTSHDLPREARLLTQTNHIILNYGEMGSAPGRSELLRCILRSMRAMILKIELLASNYNTIYRYVYTLMCVCIYIYIYTQYHIHIFAM